MIYVMADIHGEYRKFLAMLEKIRFGEEDTLYVLGDVLDRGPHPIALLRDIAARDNVILLKGNHEMMAEMVLEELMGDIREDCEDRLRKMLPKLLRWQENGANSTLDEFAALNMDARRDVMDILADLPLCTAVDAGEKTFVLVHASLGNFNEKRPLHTYGEYQTLLTPHDYRRRYFTDPSVYIVTGHVRTKMLGGKWEIWQGNGNIALDCGADLPGGKLACLCLDTMEAFYE